MSNNKKKIDESATPQQVMDAIKKRYEAKITYEGDENGKGGGTRIIQPVAYGLSKAGNPVIRAFQPFGDTTTKVPHWKLFRLDRINKWSGLRNRRFDTPPAQQWGGNSQGAFNTETDKSMSEVYMIADFEGAKRRYNDNLRKHNEKLRADKLEKDPLYTLKQNIKKSVMATPEVMKRIEDWKREQEQRTQRTNTQQSQLNTAREMASIKDFGDDTTTSTSGPLTKQDTVVQNTTQTPQTNNQEQPRAKQYKSVINNGPIYKGSEQQKAPIEQEPEIDTQDTDNNDLENNIQ